jgi:hypothetical protein
MGPTIKHPANSADKEKNMVAFNVKRKAPKEVEPLSHNGIRYETTFNGREFGFEQEEGVLIAIDEKNEQQLWVTLVYKIEINEKFERDAQICHITKIEFGENDNSLIISNERHKRFSLNLSDRQVTALD